MKYGELNLGQIEALVNKVGGMDGVHGILSGALIVVDSDSQKLVKSADSGKVSFVHVKVRDLGFTEIPTTVKLLSCIKELGKLCEPDDVLQLSGREDRFWLAMNPITDSSGSPDVFHFKQNVGGKIWRDAFYPNHAKVWDLDYVIVFRSRK